MNRRLLLRTRPLMRCPSRPGHPGLAPALGATAMVAVLATFAVGADPVPWVLAAVAVALTWALARSVAARHHVTVEECACDRCVSVWAGSTGESLEGLGTMLDSLARRHSLELFTTAGTSHLEVPLPRWDRMDRHQRHQVWRRDGERPDARVSRGRVLHLLDGEVDGAPAWVVELYLALAGERLSVTADQASALHRLLGPWVPAMAHTRQVRVAPLSFDLAGLRRSARAA